MMKQLKTHNYLQKVLARYLIGADNADILRLYKTIFNYKIKRNYEISNVLTSLISPGDYVFDIGANLGHYSCRFSNWVGKSGMVFSFEPVLSAYKLLMKMKTMLDLDNVNVFNTAVSDAVGKGTIYVPTMANTDIAVGTRASLEYDDSEFENARMNAQTVELTTIDQIVDEHGIDRLDFIKCDTEGAELKVIKGGLVTIKRFKPVIMLEIEDLTNGLELLFQLGYQPYYVEANRLMQAEQLKQLPTNKCLLLPSVQHLN